MIYSGSKLDVDPEEFNKWMSAKDSADRHMARMAVRGMICKALAGGVAVRLAVKKKLLPATIDHGNAPDCRDAAELSRLFPGESALRRCLEATDLLLVSRWTDVMLLAATVNLYGIVNGQELKRLLPKKDNNWPYLYPSV